MGVQLHPTPTQEEVGAGGPGEGPVRSVVSGQGLDQSCVRSETLMETLEGALLGLPGPAGTAVRAGRLCGAGWSSAPLPATHGL